MRRNGWNMKTWKGKRGYISLETDTIDNETANRFYQKRGFKIARKYVTPEGRMMNEYRYRRETD